MEAPECLDDDHVRDAVVQPGHEREEDEEERDGVGVRDSQAGDPGQENRIRRKEEGGGLKEGEKRVIEGWKEGDRRVIGGWKEDESQT